MFIKSPHPSRFLATIEQAQLDRVIDRQTAQAMNIASAPRCEDHHVATVVLRNGQPCCGFCYAAARKLEAPTC